MACVINREDVCTKEPKFYLEDGRKSRKTASKALDIMTYEPLKGHSALTYPEYLCY